jgi:non-heme chloroperoxidase
VPVTDFAAIFIINARRPMNRSMTLSLASLVLLLLTLSVHGKEKALWKDMFVQVGDIKIHYIEAGSGDRTLVFIPGWTMTAEAWREQIPYFSSRGFRILALDPRSQGLTTKTEKGNTYHQQAADLQMLLQRLKIERSYLVGWASGATVLLEYISNPDVLMPEKMVFVDCSPAVLKSDDYPGTMTMQKARKFLLNFQDDRAKAAEQYVRSLFKAHQPESLIKELTEGCLRTPMGAAAVLYFDQLTEDRRSALQHVPVPSLIVATPENRASGEYIKSQIPHSVLEVIEDAGSAMFMEKPQTFNQTIENFFGEQ